MDVLLVGADNPVGDALQGAFGQWGRHRAFTQTAAATRWRSERQAKRAARRDSPDAVVDLRIAWQLSSGEMPGAEDHERSHWLAKACEHSGMYYLLLSSDRVFSGRGSRSLHEDDRPDAAGAPGAQIAAMEERVLQAAPATVILRTGPLFAGSGNNLLTRTLGALAKERSVVFDDRDVFCPVASLDAARVIAAILDQLSVGAPASGIFHYCSGDRTTEYGFAEAALAAASQYVDCADVVIRATDEGEVDDRARAPSQRVLECARLRDAFAIKQVPWRGFINTVVKQHLQTQEDS